MASLRGQSDGFSSAAYRTRDRYGSRALGPCDHAINLSAPSKQTSGAVSKLITPNQFFFRSMAIGVLARATLISAIYKRSLALTVGSRAKHPNGKLTTHLSSDVSGAPFQRVEVD